MNLKIAAEFLGFHLCESCLKLNEDCLKKSAEIAKESKEEVKGVIEDVTDLKLIVRTTDKLVGVIKDRGKQIEEFQQNLKELNKVSLKYWMRTNKKPKYYNS